MLRWLVIAIVVVGLAAAGVWAADTMDLVDTIMSMHASAALSH